MVNLRNPEFFFPVETDRENQTFAYILMQNYILYSSYYFQVAMPWTTINFFSWGVGRAVGED